VIRPPTTASAPDTMETELSLELLSVPSDNASLTGAMRMSVGAAKLVPLGVPSLLLATTGISGLE